MRRRVWIIFLGTLILAVAFWYYRAGQTMRTYPHFTSDNAHISFDYPEGWMAKELTKEIGRLSVEIQIFGPRRRELNYSPYLDVSVEPLKAQTNLDAAVSAALAARGKQRSFKVVERHPTRCAGEPAIEVSAEYALQLPLGAARPKEVPFRERTLYCLKEGRFFRLLYAAPAVAFEEHLHAYLRLARSFRHSAS